MKLGIIPRVLVAVILVSTMVLGASAWLTSFRVHQQALWTRVERNALLLSETIKNSTQRAMLLNEREMVHGIIELIGRQKELQKIRVFNKDGKVIYSPDPNLIEWQDGVTDWELKRYFEII